MEQGTRELARVTSADIGEVYNGMVGLCACFEYDDGAGGQCLTGYFLDAAMVVRFMNAMGSLSLAKCVGKSCWVTHTHSKILKVEPLHKQDGVPFDVMEWERWTQERNEVLPTCYADLEGRPRRDNDA
jgi:hypothetical protein